MMKTAHLHGGVVSRLVLLEPRTGEREVMSKKSVARSRFGRYVAVGTLGFFIDAAVLTILTVSAGLDLYWARGISFVCATLATWIVNRHVVFATSYISSRPAILEYGRYLTVQALGASCNLSVFFLLAHAYPELAGTPLVLLAAGSACAVGITYLGSKNWAFSLEQRQR